MPVDFLSATPWKVLICSRRSQNGEASQWACVTASTVAAGRILMLLMILK
jgi:hypothetical protein